MERYPKLDLYLRIFVFLVWFFSLFLPCIQTLQTSWQTIPPLYGYQILIYGIVYTAMVPFSLTSLAWFSNFFLLFYLIFPRFRPSKFLLIIGILFAASSFLIHMMPVNDGSDFGLMAPFKYLFGSIVWGFSWAVTSVHAFIFLIIKYQVKKI